MGMELTKEKNDSIIRLRCMTFPSYKNWLQLPVPCNCALKLYTISWLYQNLSNFVLNVLVVLARVYDPEN